MKVTKNDLAPSRNMLKALGKGKWELDGMEIMAFSQMMQWFANLQRAMETEIAEEEEKLKKDAEQAAAPIPVATPVEDPIKHDIVKSPKKSKEK
jgi:hypothetical protein